MQFQFKSNMITRFAHCTARLTFDSDRVPCCLSAIYASPSVSYAVNNRHPLFDAIGAFR
jgi:hypothetical protein